MIAKNLTLNDSVFRVTPEKIFKYDVKSVESYRDGGEDRIKVMVKNVYDKYDSLEDSVVGIHERYRVYYDFDEAQKEQSRLRLVEIKLAADNLGKALTKHQELITKYFNKPLSNPFQDEL